MGNEVKLFSECQFSLIHPIYCCPTGHIGTHAHTYTHARTHAHTNTIVTHPFYSGTESKTHFIKPVRRRRGKKRVSSSADEHMSGHYKHTHMLWGELKHNPSDAHTVIKHHELLTPGGFTFKDYHRLNSLLWHLHITQYYNNCQHLAEFQRWMQSPMGNLALSILFCIIFTEFIP